MKRNKKIKKMLIYGILGLLLGFRFLMIFVNLGWNDDMARDQIYARLLFKNQSMVDLGHWNSVLGVSYPPYYYYILASIRSVHDSYGMVLLVHVILGIVALVFIYKITKVLSSKTEAIIAVSLCTISPIMINVNSSVWSSYFSTSIGIIAMYWGINAFYSKPQNMTQITLAIITTSFLTTIFYGATLQLLLLVVLMFWLGNRGVVKKIFIFLLAITAFSLFNFKLVSQNSVLHLINLNLNPVLDTNIVNYKNFFSQLYFNMSDNIIKPRFVVVFSVTFLLLFIIYFFSRNKRTTKIIVGSLLVYTLFGFFFSAKTGEAYHGIFQYPFIYVLFAIFSKKIITTIKGKTSYFVYIFLIVSMFYAVFPQQLFKNFINKNMSKYSLIKDYSFLILNKNKDNNVLILSPFEKNGTAIYWQSANFWYYDTFTNPKNYELQPTSLCRVATGGICYSNIPDMIILLCAFNENKLNNFLYPISPGLCSNELARIESLVGSNVRHKVDEINYITVDKNKYLKLKESLLE